MEKKKYELLKDKTVRIGHLTLYRIRALRDFGSVFKGEIGGYIEKEENLSHEGNCWVSDYAAVFENARVYGNAHIFKDAQVKGNSQVFDEAVIGGSAIVCDSATVCGKAWVYDLAYIYGDTVVNGIARIFNDSCIGSGQLSK